MRENVLRELASRATTDPAFLNGARADLEGTLARYGYHLTDEEMRLVVNLQRRSVGMGSDELARALAAGLGERTGSAPTPPAAPTWRGTGPTRPARPGGR